MLLWQCPQPDVKQQAWRLLVLLQLSITPWWRSPQQGPQCCLLAALPLAQQQGLAAVSMPPLHQQLQLQVWLRRLLLLLLLLLRQRGRRACLKGLDQRSW